MKINLVFLDSFDTEFKGNNYKIFRFLDPQSLNILSGTNLKDTYEQYKTYNCIVEFKNNKLKVVSTQQ